MYWLKWSKTNLYAWVCSDESWIWPHRLMIKIITFIKTKRIHMLFFTIWFQKVKTYKWRQAVLSCFTFFFTVPSSDSSLFHNRSIIGQLNDKLQQLKMRSNTPGVTYCILHFKIVTFIFEVFFEAGVLEW